MSIIIIDDSTCNGCGLCETMCPEVFAIRDDVATVLMDDVPDEIEEAAREAAECCPLEAISVHQAEFIDT